MRIQWTISSAIMFVYWCSDRFSQFSFRMSHHVLLLFCFMSIPSSVFCHSFVLSFVISSISSSPKAQVSGSKGWFLKLSLYFYSLPVRFFFIPGIYFIRQTLEIYFLDIFLTISTKISYCWGAGWICFIALLSTRTFENSFQLAFLKLKWRAALKRYSYWVDYGYDFTENRSVLSFRNGSQNFFFT